MIQDAKLLKLMRMTIRDAWATYPPVTQQLDQFLMLIDAIDCVEMYTPKDTLSVRYFTE